MDPTRGRSAATSPGTSPGALYHAGGQVPYRSARAVAAPPGSAACGTGLASARVRRVASTDPSSTRANPAPIETVKCSWRIVTPSTAATAGLTYVMTVARTGPISPIRAKKSRNAKAVQTTASATTDATTRPDGVVDGREKAAIGA